MQPVIGLDRLSFDSFAMKDVDHDVLWTLSSMVAHSTSNVRKLAVVYRDVVEGEAATGETELVRGVSEELCYITLYFDANHNSTASSQTGTSSPSALIFSIALKYCTSQVSLTLRPADSTTLLS